MHLDMDPREVQIPNLSNSSQNYSLHNKTLSLISFRQDDYTDGFPLKIFPSCLQPKDESRTGFTTLERNIAFKDRQQENHVTQNMIKA